jgi:hypothetical protein
MSLCIFCVWDLSLVYSEDYRKIQNVYIVKNLFQEEQSKLEETIPEDKEE